MNGVMKYFTGSIVFTVVAIVTGFLYGLFGMHSMSAAVGVACTMLVLGILETSLSFDNAIVNAKVLDTMDDKWRHRFLTWGIIIAVFGMRVVFPILIVAVVAKMTPLAALMVAIQDPTQYAAILKSSHILIAGFGGTFLLMVALKFFFDEEKEHHWIRPIENWIANAGHMKTLVLCLTISIATAITFGLVPIAEQLSFFVACMAGLVCHELVKGVAELLEEKEEHDLAAGVVKGGIMTFLYLEVLDASFSFDGVIGAFVLSNNILVIALGLGIGAMFVRSLTIYFVEKKTLAEFKYLEHGAFWSILALAGIMFASINNEIPEWVTGLLSVGFIGSALVTSIISKKKENV